MQKKVLFQAGHCFSIVLLLIDVPPAELFALFSRPAPELGLGIVNATLDTLEVTVAGMDLTIYQSPTVLRSDRSQGTTGAGTEQRTSVTTQAVIEAGPSCLENHPSLCRVVQLP